MEKKLQIITKSVTKENVLQIYGSISDGDEIYPKLINKMNEWNQKNYNRKWIHLYDYIHILKNIRNPLFSREIQFGEFIFNKIYHLL